MYIGWDTSFFSRETNVRNSEKFFASLAILSISAFFVIAGDGAIFASQGTEMQVIPMPEVIEPFTLVVYGGRIVIPESTHISIFSLKDFRLIKKFGSRGEGPGEFRYPPHITAFPDFLLANASGKLIYYSHEGDFIRETKLPFFYNSEAWPMLPVGSNYIGLPMEMEKINPGTLRLRHVGRLYDSGFKPLKLLSEGIPPLVPPPPPPPRAGTPARMTPKQDFEAIPDYVDYAVVGDRIFLADNRKGLYIAVYDRLGNLLREIKHDEKAIRVSDDYKEAAMKRLRAQPNWESMNRQFNFRFREDFPAFFSFKVANNKIYMTTYAKEGEKYEIVVMDLEGRILGRSFSFPLPPYQDVTYRFTLFSNAYEIYEDRIYYLAYNYDTDIYELHIVPIK